MRTEQEVSHASRRLADLWRISGLVYREAMFQSLYVLKRGGQLPETKAPGDFRRFMTQAAIVMKVFLCIFLAGTAVGAVLAVEKASFPGVTPAVAMAVVVGIFVLSVMFIITVMAIDVVTGFVAAKAVQTLVALPMSRREVATTTLLGFLRIFDAPLVTGVVVFAVAHAVLTRSVLGAMAYAVGVATAEAFAVVLALSLAELFYARVFNRAGSGLQSAARALYLLVSIMPGVGMYLLFSYQASAGKAVLSAVAAHPGLGVALMFIYPVSFGFVVAVASGVQGASHAMLVGSGLACLVYVGIAVLSLRWAAQRLSARALNSEVPGMGAGWRLSPTGAGARSFRLKIVAPWLGVLVKDMRIVLRSPSEAALLLMPAAAVVPWAIAMGSRGRLAMGAPDLVTFLGLMAVTAVPALVNVEAVGYTYLRTLPVKARWSLAAKAAVATTTYIASVIVLLVVSILVRRGESGQIAVFGAAGVMPTAAGSLVTGFALLWRPGRGGRGGGRAARPDRPHRRPHRSSDSRPGLNRGPRLRVSPFTSPWAYLKAVASGGLVIAVPHVAARIGRAALGLPQLPTYFILGLLEFGLVAATTLLRPRAD